MTAPPDQCELSSYSELVEVILNLRFLVREKRRRERLSMREVGRQTGLSPSTFTRFETHGHDLSTDGLVALVKWLGDVK